MKRIDSFVTRDTKAWQLFDAFMKALLIESGVITGITLVLYLAGVGIRYFTFDGFCGSLIEAGKMPCSFEYALFAEPIFVILLLAGIFSWILIPVLVIVTIGLTSVYYRHGNQSNRV